MLHKNEKKRLERKQGKETIYQKPKSAQTFNNGNCSHMMVQKSNITLDLSGKDYKFHFNPLSSGNTFRESAFLRTGYNECQHVFVSVLLMVQINQLP